MKRDEINQLSFKGFSFEAPDLAPVLTGVEPEIILLDYVQTLVENGNDPLRDQLQKEGRYADWISHERFRPWLVELLNGRRVLIVTARSRFYAKQTMARVKAHGMQVEEAFFNPGNMPPPDAKRRVLHQRIFPAYGWPAKTRYLALESNSKTRAMYAEEGIHAIPVPYGANTWRQLPKIPA